ncbi:hypothetical protein ACQ4PT_041315 [Festuca glaucescens]
MAKHPSPPSASSPARKSPQPRPAGDAIDLSAAATTTAASGPNASSSSPPAGFIFMCSGATKPQCQVQGFGLATGEAGRRLPDQARRGTLPLRLRLQVPLRTLPRRLRRRPRPRTRRIPRTLPSPGQIYN